MLERVFYHFNSSNGFYLNYIFILIALHSLLNSVNIQFDKTWSSIKVFSKLHHIYILDTSYVFDA